ncbi:hypothetical protein J6590_076029 [Homalodisca vitripennis]|nr:hypothetical protein J6590_076029 [Homalodisca vitripennis]
MPVLLSSKGELGIVAESRGRCSVTALVTAPSLRTTPVSMWLVTSDLDTSSIHSKADESFCNVTSSEEMGWTIQDERGLGLELPAAKIKLETLLHGFRRNRMDSERLRVGIGTASYRN